MSNREEKRKRLLSGQHGDREKVMTVKNVISATHVNTTLAIYNCIVIDETGHDQEDDGKEIYYT